MKNILIVEDESIVALEISTFVYKLGYSVVDTVSSGLKAIEVINSNNVDLILMDVYIKGDMDGITCAGQIKKEKNIPIIYISAFSDNETLTRAIQTQPSAYLIKPFNRKELKVAMQIATKSYDLNKKIGDVILDNEFSFDSNSCELIMLGEVIHLSKQEKHLLHLLISAKNNIISIYEIENEIWPDKESNESTRRALISRLRAKLNYKFLETIHSIGYRINT